MGRINTILRMILFISFTICLAGAAAAQTGSITSSELRKAGMMAHSFSDRMLASQDIKPLIPDFFTADHLVRSLKNGGDDWSMFLTAAEAKRMGRGELARFYVAETNWFYLSTIYTFSKPLDQSHIVDGDPMSMLPDDVKKIFNSLPDDEHAAVGNAVVLAKLLTTLETMGPLMRKHTIEIGAGHTEQWKKIMESFEADRKFYEPTTVKCDTRCYGFTKGTSFVSVDVPVFKLTFTRARGQMRVLDVQPNVGE